MPMVVHTVHANAHAFVAGHYCADADGPPNDCKGAPATAETAKCKNDGDDERAKDTP